MFSTILTEFSTCFPQFLRLLFLLYTPCGTTGSGDGKKVFHIFHITTTAITTTTIPYSTK